MVNITFLNQETARSVSLKIDLRESAGLSKTLRIISGHFTGIRLSQLLMKLWETSVLYLVATLTFAFRTNLENVASLGVSENR